MIQGVGLTTPAVKANPFPATAKAVQGVEPRFSASVTRSRIPGGGEIETFDDVVILGGARTPVESLGGKFKDVSALTMMRIAMQGAMSKVQTKHGQQGLRPESVDQVIMGNVIPNTLGAGVIQRNVALELGMGKGTTALSVNRLCGTGFEAARQAAQQSSGYTNPAEAPIIMTGGVEMMSQTPVLNNRRMLVHEFGVRLEDKGKALYNAPKGERSLNEWRKAKQEGLTLMAQGKMAKVKAYQMALDYTNPLKQGLTDPKSGLMLENCDQLADLFGISREEADAYAAASQRRARIAQKAGLFDQEITAVQRSDMRKANGDKLSVESVSTDGAIKDTSPEKLARLKVQGENLSCAIHTAGNSSAVVDGAAAVVVTSAARAEAEGINPLAKIKSVAVVGSDPTYMGIAPAKAMPAALKGAGLNWEDIDMFEINEAFAGQVLAVCKLVEQTQGFKLYDPTLPDEQNKLNIDGGGISLGHPLAATGSRIMLHAANRLKHDDKRYALVSACIGGGQGIAMVLENPFATKPEAPKDQVSSANINFDLPEPSPKTVN